jgi:PAS domain S-box-containing protein
VIVYANPQYAAMCGYDVDGLVGQNINVLDPDAQNEAVYADIQNNLQQSGQVFKGELCRRKKDGAVYWEDVTISAVAAVAGGALYYVNIAIDITEQVATRQALVEARRAAEEASKIKSEFLANMSHEIRTPMNIVLGLSKMLLKHRSENLTDYQRQRLEMIGAGGRRLMNLINDILDLSRVESGKMKITSEPISLAEMVIRGEAVLTDLLADKPVDFQITRADDVPDVVATDAQALGQILNNLLGNAVKFTERGHIHVRIRRADEQLCFAVEDTGIGIPVEAQPKIFESFTQADSSATRKYKGTGLGLAITKKLLDLMGGTITVDSTPGVGTTMTFCVPLVAATMAAAAPAAAKTTAPPRTGPRPTVLAAEDDEFGRAYLEMALEDEYDVVFACDGAEVIDKYFEVGPDVVLMDMMMPEVDGPTAFDEIRRRGGTAPVIALTARAMKDERAAILARGFTDYLSKPVDDEALIAMIEKYLKSN